MKGGLFRATLGFQVPWGTRIPSFLSKAYTIVEAFFKWNNAKLQIPIYNEEKNHNVIFINF